MDRVPGRGMLSGMLSWCRGRDLLRTAALLALFCMLVATEDPLVSLAAGALDYGAWPGEMELAVYVSGIVEGVQYVLYVEELDASQGAAGHSLQLVSTVFSSPALAERRVHGGGFEVIVDQHTVHGEQGVSHLELARFGAKRIGGEARDVQQRLLS